MNEALTTTSTEETNELLSQIVEKSNSDIILFIIILVLGLILIAVPMYRIATKSHSAEQKIQADEKRELMKVIERNTGAFTSLESTIKFNNDTLMRTINRLSTQATNIEDALTEMSGKQNSLIEKVDNMIVDVTTMDNSISEKQETLLDKADEIMTDIIAIDATMIENNGKLLDSIDGIKTVQNTFVVQHDKILELGDEIIQSVQNTETDKK